MRVFRHTKRPGFWIGFIDFFTAGLFLLFYMPLGGLQAELDEILGHRTQRYWKAYLLGVPTLFLYTLVWMAEISEELKGKAIELGVDGPYTSWWHMFGWNTFGLFLMGPAVATHRFFNTLNKVESELNRRRAAKDPVLSEEEKNVNAVIINEEKCIGCGLCVNDCPGACLYLEKDKAHVHENGCIECGHCYAVCPKGAVRLAGYDCKEEPVVPMTELDSRTLLAAMRSRRTIRHFTEQPVEKEKIRQILEAGRYSPTGGNSQSVSFTILGSRQKKAEEICVNLFKKGQKMGSSVAPFLKRIEITDTFFFKGAPLVILVSARSDVDAALASSYMEIMAESLGLGVLYSGFFITCTRISRKLRKVIRLPKGQKAVTCMVIGYPAVKYRRIVPRKGIKAKIL